MRIGIVGFGSIARRHLANIRRVIPDAHIAICHIHSEATEMPEGADEVVLGLDALVACKPQVAFVTGPANTHIKVALAMARCGADLFVEKPLSDSLDDVDLLADECRTSGRLLMVGYNLRFHEPLQVMRESVLSGAIGRVLCARAEVGQYLPDWRPHLPDYRTSVSANRELGGGVLLELSHELDYLHWILGDFKSVWGHVERIGDLEIDVEDVAEIVLAGRHGAIISVHLDMLQRGGGRFCQIHGTEGSLRWRSSSQVVELFLAKERTWRGIFASPTFDSNHMYLREIQHFFECIEARQEPSIGHADGRRVLELIAAVRRSSAEGKKLPI